MPVWRDRVGTGGNRTENGGTGWNALRTEAPTADRGRSAVEAPPIREGVSDVEIVIVESEADRIDPELVRHVP